MIRHETSGLVTCLLAAFSIGLVEANPHLERKWTGRNGKVFLGQFVAEEKDGRLHFISGRQEFRIEPENLAEADLQWLRQAQAAASGKPDPGGRKEGEAPPEGAFLPVPMVNRAKLPVIDQAKYGHKASDCAPSSVSNFLLWWDAIDFLPIDRRGDFETKAQWIHDEMARNFKTRNNSGSGGQEALAGIAKYFSEHLGETGTHRIVRTLGANPRMLSHYARGVNASILEVTIYYGRRDQGSHWVALAEADEAGRVVMHTWGQRLEGRLRKLEDVEPRINPSRFDEVTKEKYVIDWLDPESLTPWMKNYEVTFQVDPGNWDGLLVIVPSRYADKRFVGQPAPPYPRSGDAP